jgi:hypothetical protein
MRIFAKMTIVCAYGRQACGVSDKDVDLILKDGMLTITGVVSTASYKESAPLYTY